MADLYNRANLRRAIVLILRARRGGKLNTLDSIFNAIVKRYSPVAVEKKHVAQAIDDLERLGQVKKLSGGGAELIRH